MRRRFLLSFVFIILACRLYAHGGESKEVVEPVQVQSPILLSAQDVHYQVSLNFSGLYPFNGFLAWVVDFSRLDAPTTVSARELSCGVVLHLLS